MKNSVSSVLEEHCKMVCYTFKISGTLLRSKFEKKNILVLERSGEEGGRVVRREGMVVGRMVG